MKVPHRKTFTRRHWLAGTALAGGVLAGRGLSNAMAGSGVIADPPATPLPVARNVLEFGARGDAKTDDTAAFQKALDAAHAGGGGLVPVPAGYYLLAGSLRVPDQTALQGCFRGPTSHIHFGRSNQAVAGRPAAGTVLLATGGKAAEEGTPLMTLGNNAAVLGVCIYYPDQDWQAKPVAYPWTIRLSGSNCTVQDVELVNAWRGIQGIKAHRHLIRNVTGQPLRAGIYLDEITDIGRIENVHFNPWWSGSRPVLELTYRHGESFVFGRSDWQYVFNTFSFGYHAGYRFFEGKTGSCNGNFLGIGADASCNACVMEQVQGSGLLITNGEFVSFDYLHLGGDVDPAQILIKPSNRGPVRFVNCSFWGPARQIARLHGNSTAGFGDCTFRQWDHSLPALEAHAGKLFVNGCEFQQVGKQISLGAPVSQAVISGNIAQGKWQVVNHSHGDVQTGLNSATG